MDDIVITDTIQADQIEDGDQILAQDDMLSEVEVVLDDDKGRIVSGYSHNTGDRVCLELAYDESVQLWTV